MTTNKLKQTRRPKEKLPWINLCQLPIDKINNALGTDLEPGLVVVSPGAQAHIKQDHPEDYLIIMDLLADFVANPLYIGQDPKHADNFYLVKPLPAHAPNPHGLVSIGFEKDDRGQYRLKTAYSIPQDTVNKRRAANRLHRAI